MNTDLRLMMNSGQTSPGFWSSLFGGSHSRVEVCHYHIIVLSGTQFEVSNLDILNIEY